MLGTSARIGEVLAIRRRDLDLTTTPATLRICGTVISERGVGTYRQEHPKTDRSNRVIALPSFTAEALRRRLAIMADHSLDALVFRSREGTPLTTANVRRQLRKVLGAAGIEGVSPHMFRRTVATVINEQASLNLASELLGHTDPKVTIEHYIRRNEQVNPLTAELLDSAFSSATEHLREPTALARTSLGHRVRGAAVGLGDLEPPAALDDSVPPLLERVQQDRNWQCLVVGEFVEGSRDH